jgi:hypothetical protein
VLFFTDFHMSKRLRRLMRQGRYTVTFDHNFEGVIKACAGKREGRWPLPWITPRIMHAYATPYDAEYAHSFEVWNEEGALVGGVYGVAIDKMYVIRSGEVEIERDGQGRRDPLVGRHFRGNGPDPRIAQGLRPRAPRLLARSLGLQRRASSFSCTRRRSSPSPWRALAERLRRQH